MQKIWLAVVFFFVLSCPSAALSVAQITGPVQVEGGLVAGTAGDDASVRVFKGIPYAAPPVDDRRWRSPQPVQAWSGVLEADTFGPSCMQDLIGSRPPWTEPFMVQNEVSEDCLYLNVWTAAESAEARRPVLVYVHGGAFSEGSGSVAVYDGEELAKKGLVVVTVNYRLGTLGFFAHPGLTAESEYGASGNYGLLDQLAALQWVQENIAAFGGDPGKVTLAGQSAGAASVHYLVASPLAKGLFHRAIAQSGSGVGRYTQPLADAEQEGVKFARGKNAASVRALRAMPVADLLASGSGQPSFRFRPVVGGTFLPEDPAVIFAEGRQNDVPTLTGLNADEGSASPTYGKTPAAAYGEQVQSRYGDQAIAFLNLYPASTDKQASLSQKASARDQGIVSMSLWAKNRAATAQSPAYLYYFDRGMPWPEYPDFGAFHTGEVAYVFNNLKVLERPWTDVDREVADTMSTYWVNFATTGNPNGAGLPRWEASGADDVQFIRLGEQVEPLTMPSAARRAFFETQLTR